MKRYKPFMEKEEIVPISEVLKQLKKAGAKVSAPKEITQVKTGKKIKTYQFSKGDYSSWFSQHEGDKGLEKSHLERILGNLK